MHIKKSEINKSNFLDIDSEIEYFKDWLNKKDVNMEEVKIYKVAKWSNNRRKEKLSHYKVRRIKMIP